MQTTTATKAGNAPDLLSGILSVQVRNEDKITEQDRIYCQNLQLDNDKRYAVVLGNEVKGVHQEVVDKSDCCLEIPQFGTKHSLNVSVTAGMVIWEFAKRLML